MAFVEGLLEVFEDEIGDWLFSNPNLQKGIDRLLVAISTLSGSYLVHRGQEARTWLEDIINRLIAEALQDDPMPELDPLIARRMVNHIANEHLTDLSPLLWAELVQQGCKPEKALLAADKVYKNTLRILWRALRAGKQAETGTLADVSEEVLGNLERLAVPVPSVKMRVVCPGCYRVVRDWDTTKETVTIGPAVAQCEKCNALIPTPFTPWDRATRKQKAEETRFAIGTIIVSVLAMVLSPFIDPVLCLAVSGVGLLAGILLVISTRKQIKESRTTPRW